MWGRGVRRTDLGRVNCGVGGRMGEEGGEGKARVGRLTGKVAVEELI
jgi:hypothetical protein